MCLQVAFPSTSVIILSLLLGSKKRFWSNVSTIFEMVISEAKLRIAVSLCKCISINLGETVLIVTLLINWWWSENCLIRIPAVNYSIIILILQI